MTFVCDISSDVSKRRFYRRLYVMFQYDVSSDVCMWRLNVTFLCDVYMWYLHMTLLCYVINDFSMWHFWWRFLMISFSCDVLKWLFGHTFRHSSWQPDGRRIQGQLRLDERRACHGGQRREGRIPVEQLRDVVWRCDGCCQGGGKIQRLHLQDQEDDQPRKEGSRQCEIFKIQNV